METALKWCGRGRRGVRRLLHDSLIFAAVVIPAAASAQEAAPQRSGLSAFAIEAAGGIVGSAAGGLAGIAIYRAVGGECPVEDLGCIIKMIGTAGIGSTIGSAVGTIVAGRAADTRPSALGAALGAVAGLFAGAGAVNVLEELNLRSGPQQATIYFVTQGLVTALGSRLVAAVRR